MSRLKAEMNQRVAISTGEGGGDDIQAQLVKIHDIVGNSGLGGQQEHKQGGG